MARGRYHLHRRFHWPARCHDRATGSSGSRARVPLSPECRQLGCDCLFACLRGDSSCLQPHVGNFRPQGSFHHWLRRVRYFFALCGTVSNLSLLIALRIVQGIGGALIGANSITILVKAAGPARRGRAMGILAGAQAIGISAGPAVGGMLLATLGWRWVFWASAPFGLLGSLASWLVFPRTTQLASG